MPFSKTADFHLKSFDLGGRIVAHSVVTRPATLVDGADPLVASAHERLDRWLAQREDATRRMQGDRVVATPAYEMTMTRVATAQPRHVWPWLMQLGNGRGGLYSYDLLDRFFGYLDRPSATTLLPEFQQLRPGDQIPVGRGGNFPVLAVDPNHSLLMGGQRQQFQWSWEIALDPVDTSHTRIASRSRGQTAQTLGARLFTPLLGLAAWVMTRRMLLIGLTERAERLALEETARGSHQLSPRL